MVVLSGSNTLIGSNLLPLLRNEYQVCAIDKELGDIADLDFLTRLFDELNPVFFINCEEMGNIEECEYKRDDAYAINGNVPGSIAELCGRKNVTMVQISTSYVFDGKALNPYAEEDETKPVTVYGQSKLLAEKKIIESGCRYLIVRSPHCYGRDRSFLQQYIEKMRDGDTIVVAEQQKISPAYVKDISEMISVLLRNKSEGIYHVSNIGIVTMKEFLNEFASQFGSCDKKDLVFNFEEYPCDEIVSPCDIPLQSSLDVAKYSKQFGQPRKWKTALSEFIKENVDYL